MKTFREFILICEKLNKTHDENSQSKLWNYFVANPDNIKIRDLILDKNFKEAEKEIKKEVEAAKANPEHPLNFNNAGDEEFSKKEGRQPGDESPYNDFLDDSISGLLALSKQKKLKSAIEKGFPSRVTGSGVAELSKQFKSAGGTDKTPKGDLEIYNPDNPKDRRGVSMKKGAGAQLASAEGGEIKGMYKVAAKEYVKRFHSDKSKEERKKIEKEIMNDAERLSAMGRLQKTADEAPDVEKQKQSLKNISQGISDRLLDKYPQFERLLSQVATSGKGKFGGDEGTAGIVLTGKTGNKEATAKPAEQQKSAKPRLALPKGRNRPGNLKIDYRPTEETSRQSTFSDFSRKAAQFQQQAAQAQQDLEAANVKAQDASVPINPETGEPILRQYRKNIEVHMAADPTSPTAQVNNQRRQQAQNNLAAAQSNFDNASANYQATVSASQQQQSTQQPNKSTEPSQATEVSPTSSQPQQSQPTEMSPPEENQQLPPQQEKPKEDNNKKRKKSEQSITQSERSADQRARMDVYGRSQGLPEYA